jgi:hypothetical protein
VTDTSENKIGHPEKERVETVPAGSGLRARLSRWRQSRWWKTLWTKVRPALVAYAFLGFVALVYWLLGIGQGNSDIAQSLEWMTWKALAAFAVGIALASITLGIAAVQRVTEGKDTQRTPQSPTADRLAEPLRQDTQGKLVIYSLAAFALTAAIVAFLALGVPRTQKWPTDLDMDLRTVGVVIPIGVAAVPWLVLVWLLQDRLAGYVKHQTTPSTADLRRLWDSLYAIVLAFAIFVVLALVPTGALRAAYFAGAKDPAANKEGPEFPASSVLLYGAFFALLLLAIALPMVTAYRAAARRCVEASHDIKDPPDKDDKDARAWHEELLHLDISVLRSPITALTVFTPLITAALAAYLPDLAQ